ncbi:membrane protein insertion efficiency factor YidD [Massilia glaciei]|uniref:Membrane protein insertion efficiency factor YidD n=1 Tax=Massilia glaciei TaxID=1524097 RepID=A0A2U2HNX7_9BURK|nr:membrane protein insertion efficiency factor YidD [Massilia glaciei]PWF49224.1 membrane protein insertion efficiency factor YidD [Massilia glaciei]
MHKTFSNPIDSVLRALALGLIRFYRRFISPYKGFRCAYCAMTGNASCSTLGYRAVRRYGAFQGVQVLRGRLFKCGLAYRRYHAPALRSVNRQAGFCDCDPGCDMPGTGGGGGMCDKGGKACGCATDIIDCGSSDKKKRRRDEERHIPPPSGGNR